MRLLLQRTLFVLLTTCGVMTTLAALPTDSPSAGAERWVRGLTDVEREMLLAPTRLGGVPGAYRRAFSKTLREPSARRAYLEASVSIYERSRGFSTEERQLLDEVRALIPLVAVATVPKSNVAGQVAAVRARVMAVLGPDAVRALFYSSDTGPDKTAVLPLLERAKLAWRLNRPMVVAKILNLVVPVMRAESPTCNCGPEGNWDCNYGMNCNSANECEPYEPPVCLMGCGEWGCYGCWLTCNYEG